METLHLAAETIYYLVYAVSLAYGGYRIWKRDRDSK